MSAKTTSQLQLTPMRIPAIRPSSKLEFTRGRYRVNGRRCSVVVGPVRPDRKAAHRFAAPFRDLNVDQHDRRTRDFTAVGAAIASSMAAFRALRRNGCAFRARPTGNPQDCSAFSCSTVGEEAQECEAGHGLDWRLVVPAHEL
jgi:hypothetical protein